MTRQSQNKHRFETLRLTIIFCLIVKTKRNTNLNNLYFDEVCDPRKFLKKVNSLILSLQDMMTHSLSCDALLFRWSQWAASQPRPGTRSRSRATQRATILLKRRRGRPMSQMTPRWETGAAGCTGFVEIWCTFLVYKSWTFIMRYCPCSRIRF